MRTSHYDRRFESVVRQLCVDPHPVTRQPIFPTLRGLLCFAAALGYERNNRVPLQADQIVFVDGRIFSNHQPAVDLLYLIALASSGDMNILREEREGEMADAFEQFANGGLEVLSDWLNAPRAGSDGHQAILAALRSEGYLASQEGARNLDDVLPDVSF